MIRIQLKNSRLRAGHLRAKAAIPRVILASLTGFVALALWACSSGDFGGTPPQPPARAPSKKDPKPTNPDGEITETPPQNAPAIPKRTFVLQITGVQPEAWWNNCLKVEFAGKAFDIACTKDTNVTQKVVRIPIPDDVTCPVLDLKVETYKNIGETCNERAKQGLACEGPFETTPSQVRSYGQSADRLHFVLSEGVKGGSGQVVRAFFEDQDEQNIRKAKDDPSLADSLGVDFNDAIFEITTLDVPFEISGAPGTKCK